MSREIRRTPVGWWPPIIEQERLRYGVLAMTRVPQPQHDWSFEEEQARRASDLTAFVSGRNAFIARYGQSEYDTELASHHSYTPDPAYYHPTWTDEERNGYQLYETVSEGSPLSPSFATQGELIEYLITVGPRSDAPLTREHAEGIVRDGWAPSGTFTANGPRDSYGRPIQLMPRL